MVILRQEKKRFFRAIISGNLLVTNFIGWWKKGMENKNYERKKFVEKIRIDITIISSILLLYTLFSSLESSL